MSNRRRTFQVWKDRTGQDFLILGNEPSPRDGPAHFVREFEAANWLEAYVQVGEQPATIDQGIKNLVDVLNNLPGIMTTGSCEGHLRAGDTSAYVSFTVDDVATLRALTRLLQFGPDYPVIVRLYLCFEDDTGMLADLPSGMLEFTMELMRASASGELLPPTRSQLARVAADLSKRYSASQIPLEVGLSTAQVHPINGRSSSQSTRCPRTNRGRP